MFTFFFSSVFPYSSLSHSSQPLNTIFLYSFGSTSPSCLSLSYLSLSLGGPCPVISLALFSFLPRVSHNPPFLLVTLAVPSPRISLSFNPFISPCSVFTLAPLVLPFPGIPFFSLSHLPLWPPYPLIPLISFVLLSIGFLFPSFPIPLSFLSLCSPCSPSPPAPPSNSSLTNEDVWAEWDWIGLNRAEYSSAKLS